MENKDKQATAKAFPKWLQISWLVVLLAVPLVLWVLPSDHFDEGESMCPSIQLFDTECPGCGSTRAVQHLHHAELADALYFHKLSPLIYIFLVYLWGTWTYSTALRLGVFGKEKAAAYEQKLAEKAHKRLLKRQNISS